MSGCAPRASLREVIVHPAAARSPLAARLRAALPGCVRTGPAPRASEPDPAAAKALLHLAPVRGRLLKRCPGTPGYLCCGYHVLNVLQGCPFDCSYCILQLYLNRPATLLAANWEDGLGEVDRLLARRGGPLRVGTGELADSLALEPVLGIARELVLAVRRRPRVLLELKTKSTCVEGLLGLEPRGRVVVSWTLNAERVVRAEERGAPGLEARLRAAAACAAAGYRIGLHFDPLVRFPGWERAYDRVVEAAADHLPAASLAWISLGSLRFPPALGAVLNRRFPDSPLPLGEFVAGLDGKRRYYLPLRVAMYRRLGARLHRWAPRAERYLCMESPVAWGESLGWSPASTAAVGRRLDALATRILAGRP